MPSDPTGGPAFPCTKSVTAVCPDTGKVQETYIVPTGGMSLRDYFAAKAMAALLVGEDQEMRAKGNGERTGFDDQAWDDGSTTTYAQRAAIDAYIIADAMLAARNGGAK